MMQKLRRRELDRKRLLFIYLFVYLKIFLFGSISTIEIKTYNYALNMVKFKETHAKVKRLIFRWPCVNKVKNMKRRTIKILIIYKILSFAGVKSHI